MKLLKYIEDGNISITECMDKIFKVMNNYCKYFQCYDESDGLISIRFPNDEDVKAKVEYKEGKYVLIMAERQYPTISRIIDIVNNIDFDLYCGSVAIMDKFIVSDLKYDIYEVSNDDRKRISDVLYKINIVFLFSDINSVNDYLYRLIEAIDYNAFIDTSSVCQHKRIVGKSLYKYTPINIKYNKTVMHILYPDFSRADLCSCYWPVVNFEKIIKDKVKIGDKIILRNKNSDKESIHTIIDISTLEGNTVYALSGKNKNHFLIDEYDVDCAFEDLYPFNRKQFNGSMRNKKIYLGVEKHE